MLEELDKCTICPHECKINRNEGKIGRCKSTDKIKIALYSTHNFEEPCISGKRGSGTVFFSNCNLNCVFCQNYEISQQTRGKEIEIEDLAKIFLEQQKKKLGKLIEPLIMQQAAAVTLLEGRKEVCLTRVVWERELPPDITV